MSRRKLLLLWACLGSVLSMAVAGCRSPESYEFDKLDITPTQDELIEYSLGTYVIPIPLTKAKGMDDGVKRNRLEFSFKLHALVMSDSKKQLAAHWKRHEGKVRDRIIIICRNATLSELQEPELATLKSHLTDAVQSEVGGSYVRRLLISDVVSRKL